MHSILSLQAHVLALMGWADGELSQEERQVFEAFLGAGPGSDEQVRGYLSLLDDAPQEDVVHQMLSDAPAAVGFAVLKMAHLLAHADGVFDANERALMSRLIGSVGVTGEHLDDFYELLELNARTNELESRLLEALTDSKEV